MTPTPRLRRLLLAGVVLLLVLPALGWLGRAALARLAVTQVLQLAGASAIKFRVAAASPWHVELEQLDFRVRTQAFAAGRVVLERAHWWMPSLGQVAVTDARVPVTIDGSDINPWTWASYENGTARIQPLALPIEELAVDGQVLVQAAALPAQPATVRLRAQRTSRTVWRGEVSATGPGLEAKGEGTVDAAKKELRFQLTEVALELKPWQDYLQRLMLLPGGAWELAGRADGHAAGRWRGKEFAATATVRLREGHARNLTRAVSAEGVEADIEFTDLDGFRTKPGTLRISELRTGRLALRAIDAEFAFEGADRIAVTQATFSALGGRATLEPFKYFLNLRELEAVAVVDGIDVAEVLALTQNVPAQASGRVDGRLPFRLDEGGLRLGTGSLALKPGVAAGLQFNATGLLRLRLTELRLEIRPPNAPPGCSATLHLAGEPLNAVLGEPVSLDLNVNGPLEKFLNLGWDARTNPRAKP